MADATATPAGNNTGKYIKYALIGVGSLAGLYVISLLWQKFTTPAVTSTLPLTTGGAVCASCSTSLWAVGLPVITTATQNIINALMSHGGNAANASSLQTQYSQNIGNANGMANVLSGACNELKAQFMNKNPNTNDQNTFNAAYNNGMNSAANIESMIASNNSALITSNTNAMVNVFVNP